MTDPRYANLPTQNISVAELREMWQATSSPIMKASLAQLIASADKYGGITGPMYEKFLDLKQQSLNEQSGIGTISGNEGDIWRSGIRHLESLYPPEKGWIIMSEIPNTADGTINYTFKNLLENVPIEEWSGTYDNGNLVAATTESTVETVPVKATDWHLSVDRMDDGVVQISAKVPSLFDLNDGSGEFTANVGDTFYSTNGGATWTRGVAPFSEAGAVAGDQSNYDALQLMLDYTTERRLTREGEAADRQAAAKLGFSYQELAQNTALEQARQAEAKRQFGLSLGEQQRQFNVNTRESALQRISQGRAAAEANATQRYFSSLEELGRNYRTMVETSPAMANAATNQGELIRNILREGGDVLARTYFTRGGISPLPEITQADLINNLNDEMVKLQQFEIDAVEQENRRIERADRDRARAEYQVFVDAEMQKPQEMRQLSRFDQEQFDEAIRAYNEFEGSEDYIAAQAALADAQEALAGFDFATSMKANLEPAPEGGWESKLASDAAAQAAHDAAEEERRQLQIAVGQAESHFSVPSQEQFTERWQELAPREIPTFENWSVGGGPSFGPSPLLNVPQLNIPRRVSQGELIAQSRATTPPAVASVMSGQMPRPLSFGGLPLPTFQQLQSLTPTEQQMFNQRLMTEFNVPLEDVALQSQRQFRDPSADRSRDLARFRGYSV